MDEHLRKKLSILKGKTKQKSNSSIVDAELNGNDKADSGYSNLMPVAAIGHHQYEPLDLSRSLNKDPKQTLETTVSETEHSSLNTFDNVLGSDDPSNSIRTFYEKVKECENLLEDHYPIRVEQKPYTTDMQLTKSDYSDSNYTDFLPASRICRNQLELIEVSDMPDESPEPAVHNITVYEKKKKPFSNTANSFAVKGPSQYTCDKRHEVFKREHLLEYHNLIHTRQKMFYCDICKQSLNSYRCPKHHWLTLSKERAPKCDKEHTNFSRKETLDRHYLNDTVEKPYECEKCKMTFSDQKFFKKHQTNCGSSVVELKYECDICDKRFSEKYHLNIHYRIHTVVKPYKCDKCGKSFSDRSNYKRHERNCGSSVAEIKYECDKCNKRFSQKQHLVEHYRTHTGEKPYSCEKCKIAFSNKSNFRRHKKNCGSSVPEGPHECHICHKRFSRKEYLVGHSRIHTGEKPFNCEKCGKYFRHRSSLRVHRKICCYVTETDRIL